MDIGLSRFQYPSQMLARNVGIEQAQAQTAQTRQQTSALEQQQRLQQQQAVQQAALQQLTQEAFQNPQALNALAAVDPERASKIQEYQTNQALFAGQAAMAFKALDADQKPKAYRQTLNTLAQRGIDISQLPDEYDPELVGPEIELAINSARDIEKQIGNRQIIETAQGTFTVDPQTGQATPVQIGGQQLTPYVKPPSTQITIDNKAESKEAEKLAELRAERFNTLLQSGDAARRGYETLDTLERAVSNPNAAQGAFAGVRSESKKIADLFGFNVEGLEDDAIIASVGNKLALQLRNPKGEDGGLTGATSDRDIKFLVAGVPNRDKTRTQNLALIKIAKKDKERTAQLAAFADQYLQETGSLKGLEMAKKDWLENHPLYEEGEEKEAIKQMLKGEGVKSGQVNGVKWRVK